MKTLLFIFGTRPEAIKMAPLIKKFSQDKNIFDIKVCVTGQHRQMLDQVLDFFNIKANFDLNIMKNNQTLFDVTVDILKGLEKILNDNPIDYIFVQGDTTSAFVGALAGFYKKIKVGHIEAGLRSGNKYSPYPEEINRILAGHIADYHFAPTPKAKENLQKEGITDNIYVVGNTVIDALFLGLDLIKSCGDKEYYDFFKNIDFSKKIILVTGHRRESFGEPFKEICYALKELKSSFKDVEIIYPVHLNPNVRKPVNEILSNISGIHLIEPLSYPHLIWLMNKSYLVLTDSGGIQEEAPSLKKPVLVMRDVTERTEGVDAGTAKLVGTDKQKIIQETSKLILDSSIYQKMSNSINPYGDGTTSEKVLNIMKSLYNTD
ncbi:MAG: UDP-N-acetylglucosamine 2-epimerase [Spirochaetes bacterium GWD1_27_9]|nr:MAG: UDP-N-acetylglucosamine 2-epimerase [Spirochaetes bacterium GWC1_27_15]OHD33625.1 MAG: UDP-N-acetylglucosamine 2-epimerase [Spirochaetes bacterium GWD1_27_9]